MSVSVRENLVGYLLGALDAEEHRQVEQALIHDPILRDELSRLAQLLPDVEHDREHDDAPPGLAEQTCRWISLKVDEEGDASLDCLEPPANRVSGEVRSEKRETRRKRESAEESRSNEKPTPASLRPVSRSEGEYVRRWSFADLFVAAGIVLSASFLFLPALSHSRFAAQRNYCQENLRQIGMALAQYSEVFASVFPQIPEKGNRSFAGIYLPTLRDNQFLADSNLGRCPSSSFVGGTPEHMPTLREIDSATPTMLAKVRSRANGGYGYNVGYLHDSGKYVGPRNLRRAAVGLVADAPSIGAVKNRTDNHGGRGQNVLYEDLHIGFIPGCIGDDCPDSLYLNRHGRVGPGTDENDTVIVNAETLIEDLLGFDP